MNAAEFPVGRCHYVRDEDGEEIMIPKCVGSAVFGISGCTCDGPMSEIEALEERLLSQQETTRVLRANVARLHQEIERHHETFMAHRIRIRRLEAER